MFVVKKNEDLGRSVSGGVDGRAANAPVTLVKKKVVADARGTLSEYAAVLYDNDAGVLEHFDAKLRSLRAPLVGFRKDPVVVLQTVMRRPRHYVPRILKYYTLRFLYVLMAEWRADRIRHANLSWLTPEQIVILTHWYLSSRYMTASLLDPRFWHSFTIQRKSKSKLAHDCVAYLLHKYAGRYSKVDSWRQAYYHYLHARVLHARDFPIPMLNRAINDALRLSEQWSAIDEPIKRAIALRHCIRMKINLGKFYWKRAVVDWSGQRGLYVSAQTQLTEAHELAKRFGTEPEIAEEIMSVLEKVNAAAKVA